MTSTRTTTTTTYETRGTEPLTVKTLIDILQDYPADAVVRIEQGEGQRDGVWWRVTSTYVPKNKF